MKKHQAVLCAVVLSVGVMLLRPSVAYMQGANIALSVTSVNPKAFPEMEVFVNVLDANGVLIPNLEAPAFQILEDGRAVTVKEAKSFSNMNAPIAVCLAIDRSGSMVGQPFENAKAAARAFIDEGLGEKDQAAIIAFSDQVNINTPLGSDPARELALTYDKNLLKNLIEPLQADSEPGTPLYDAAFKCIKGIAQASGMRAVILFTDGKDEKLNKVTNKVEPGSISTLDSVVTAARDARLPIHTVGLGNEIDVAALSRLAALTGGTFQRTQTPSELAGLFKSISTQLKTQYSVKYDSELLPDDRDHALQINVKTPIGQTETRATVNLPRTILTKPFIRLYYNEGDERKDLKDNQILKGNVTIAPQIVTANVLTQAVFLVDNTPVYTATVAPYNFVWETKKVREGDHQLTVRAYDQKGQNEKSVRVTIVYPTLIEEITDLPLGVKLGIGVGMLVVLVAIVGGIAYAASRTKTRLCPAGLHVMPPGAVVCPFCEAGRPSADIGTQPPTIPEYPIQSPTPIAGGRTEVLSTEEGSSAGHAPASTMILGKPQLVSLAFLVIETGPHAGKEFKLLSETAIGRAGENDIVLDDPAVSRNHAKIKAEGKEFYIYDLAATNPTLINGKGFRGRRKLVENDRIQMGNTTLVFKQIRTQT